MPADKYKFISPGVFIKEIDNTGRPAEPGSQGPAIIGRAQKGPILKPIKVNSYADFVTIFGAPAAGAKGGDISRDGNFTAPTYGAYGAQAWFKNDSPVTYVRLGGQPHAQATAIGRAGWRTQNAAYTTNASTNGGAYGLFVADLPGTAFLTGKLEPHTAQLQANDFFEIGDGFPGVLENIRHISCSMESPPVINEFQFVTGASDVITAANIAEAIQSGTTVNQVGATTLGSDTVFLLTCWDVLDTECASLYGNGGQFGIGPTLLASSSLPLGTGGLALTASVTPTTGPDIVILNDTTGTLSQSADLAAALPAEGCLAAVWYLDKDLVIGLSGTRSQDGLQGLGTGVYFDSVGTKTFNVRICEAGCPAGGDLNTNFDFTSTSDTFIRKVFNTNPALTNAQVTNNTTDYWLGESYEGLVNETCTRDVGAGSQIGVILPLQNASTFGGNFQKADGYQNAQTGWFFSQDLAVGTSATSSYDPSDMPLLFKLVARNSGDWVARNLKVSIQDIKRSSNAFDPYGTFTVALRSMSDTDNRLEFVEQFNNCTLNARSENFIGRLIGDRFVTWDDETRSYTEFGDYPNLSAYVRVELNDSVKKGDTDARLLPFGVRGPLRFDRFLDLTGNVNPSYVLGNFDDMNISPSITTFISGATNGNIAFDFPKLRMRRSAAEGDPVDQADVYFGVDTTFNGSRFEASVVDHLKIKPRGVDDFIGSTTNSSSISSFFTLDDMCNTSLTSDLTGTNVYVEGSRAAEKTGITDSFVTGTLLNYIRGSEGIGGTGSYVRVLEGAGANRFTTVFFGGFDGLNIKEAEPFSNRLLETPTDPKDNYALNSVQVAIDSLRDPEVVTYDLAAMPGIKNNTLNRSLINLCESRGDAMAVIDLRHDYISEYESVASPADRLPQLNNAVENLRNNLAVNSSYAAAYFPWVQIRDRESGQYVWVPPSVVALGTMAHTQRTRALWFAPAGFTRANLSIGDGGVTVVDVRLKLNSEERDTLYDAKINPIATFQKQGIIIFGQKTLQATESALDRIGVRRLLIFLKKRVSHYAATLLFATNVETTWKRFRGVVEPFLAGVQARLGIAEYKLVLDETTTTPELIAQNVMYAKIYIKPTRSIEFIAIDFILTDTGAGFED